MFRYLRAMAWLRWRVMLNSSKPSQKRDTMEQLSRLGAVVAPALMAVALIPSTIILGVMGYYSGLMMASDPYYISIVSTIARVLVAVSFFAVLLAPLVRTIQGAHIGIAARLCQHPDQCSLFFTPQRGQYGLHVDAFDKAEVAGLLHPNRPSTRRWSLGGE